MHISCASWSKPNRGLPQTKVWGYLVKFGETEKMKALRSNFRYITAKQTGPAWQEIREDYGRKRNEEKAFAFYSVLPPILFQS